MSKHGKKVMIRVQRKAALRVASPYSTVSTEASLLLADLPPIDLLALERRSRYIAKRSEPDIDSGTQARKNVLIQWQSRWDAASMGR